MSTVGIGLAWVLMTTAAFVALSASALARTRNELEADPGGSHSEGTPARERSHSVPLHVPTRTHWLAVEVTPASPALRSSPSMAQMHATADRPGPIHLS